MYTIATLSLLVTLAVASPAHIQKRKSTYHLCISYFVYWRF